MLRRQVLLIRIVLFIFAVAHNPSFAEAARRSDASGGKLVPASVKTSSKTGDASGLQQVASGVYSYKDTCNVYAIVNDRRAILIDFGSGEILNRLQSLGVQNVDWILHTHFHRDQAQGDRIAMARGIKIGVPASERKYFDQAESFWNGKTVMNLADMRNEFFTLRQNVAVDFELKPWSVFTWNGISLNVLLRATRKARFLSLLNAT
jgi:glyoxylase-like metal-dependent hydrolase (beta-lactamase superfamily II)